jgi:putative ABC transport system permease protein
MMSQDAGRMSRLGRKVLSAVLGRGEHFTVIGDLEEIHAEIAREKGPFRAGAWYWGQILRSIPAYASHLVYWSGVMLKNYFVTTLRTIKKQKAFTFINVLGLAIGMAACLLALLYIRDEFSYDMYNLKADRIHRVGARVVRQGQEFNISGACAPLARHLKDNFPEVEDAVRMRQGDSIRLKAGEASFRESKVVYSEPSFFNIFTVPLLQGDPETALASRRSLVLSRTAAAKYFGKANPVGKTVLIDGAEEWAVTGVFEDIPRTSHFHFDVIRSFASLDVEKDPLEGSWMSFNYQTYVLFREGASTRDLAGKLDSVIMSRMAPEVKQMMGISVEDFLKRSGMQIENRLQPLRDIHLRSGDGISEFEANGDIKSIALFSAVSLFILLLAAVNFVNLATARSSGRAKEVGVRKVLGSLRRDLVGQFLLESLVFSLIALLFAVLLVWLALPVFNQLSGKDMEASLLATPGMAAAALGLVLLIALLAGAYPAFYISAFRPAPILKGEQRTILGGGLLRRALVVFQFAVSIVLIVGTLVVFRQLRYIRSEKVGFNRDQVLVLDNVNLLGTKAEAFKEEMLAYPRVVKASLSSFLPVPSARNVIIVAAENDPDGRNAPPVAFWTVDHDYIETLEMKLVAGRNFSRELATDTEAVILNEAAVRKFQFDAPLGKRVVSYDVGADGQDFVQKTLSVVGVVEDFNFESLRTAVEPLVLRLGPSRGKLILRVRAGDMKGTIDALRRKWAAFAPAEPFEYFFLDDRFNTMYGSELRTGRVFGSFAGLAVLIGCLGLFGLAAFSAAKRTREIGIHKVFGATVPDVLKLLVREYVLLVVAANVVAWPIAFLMMSAWLRNFAYRTGVGWEGFVGTGLATLVLAVLTVGFQSVKAASASPAEALKYE